MSKEFSPINCEIVENAKILATSKGLDADRVSCPFLQVCNGSECVWDMVPLKPLIKPIGKELEDFYGRLEKWKKA